MAAAVAQLTVFYRVSGEGLGLEVMRITPPHPSHLTTVIRALLTRQCHQHLPARFDGITSFVPCQKDPSTIKRAKV